MESKKINQLATNVNPQTSDLTTIGDPVTGQLKKITWLQVAHLIGAQASLTLQDVTNQGATTTLPITTGGLTLSNLDNGVLKVAGGVVSTYPYGQANGVASLDSGGKVPASQLPSSIMDYKGTWNAATNTPTLVNGTGDTGDVYRCNVAGTVNFGAGNITFKVGDWAIYNGTIWEQSNNSDAVSSVFGRTGDITAQEGDYNIGQLGDVTITSAATNDYLRYNGTGWVNTQFPTFVSSDKLVLQVRNTSGATINKGTVVYVNGASGGYPTIAKAQADADNTSAQTLGLVQDNISNNSNGVVVIVGQITGIDTSAYPAGTQLYLSGTTAGAFTSTKTLAPTHLVYVGIVTTQNAVNGVIEVKIQNGYELDEIHDVAISSVANNQGLFYESSTSLWKNKSIATVLGYTPEQPLTFSAPLSRSTNTVSIPAATGSVNGYLTSTDWTTFNNKITNPMTTLGDIIFGGTSGNPNRLAGNTTTTKQYLSQTGTGTDSASPTWATISGSDITGAALTKTDDTNVTLTLGGTPATALLRAASLTLGWTGQLAISRGGTGASTKGAAFDALSPMSALGDLIYGGASGTGTRLSGSTSASKRFLTQTGDGTNSAAPAWGTVSASDITGAALTKTDDTNVTLTLGGTPATALLRAASLTLGWTGQLSVARGGTGLSALGTEGQLLRVNTGATALEYFTPTYISAAITSLNGLTAATQTFATGTTGTDFNISSASGVHTFNIPSASATNRGLVTTGTQTFAGDKTISGSLIVSASSSTFTGASHRLFINRLDNTNVGSIIFSTNGASTGNGWAEIGQTDANGDLYFKTNATAGTFTTTMILKSDRSIQIPYYTTNGFVKTSSANGTLIIDNTSYQPLLTNPITGDGTETAGNVAYFTGNTAIAGSSSLFFDTAKGLGINVAGTVNSSLDVGTTNTSALLIGNTSDTIVSGDIIGNLSFFSRDLSTNSRGTIASIRSYATATYNTGSVSGDLRFYVSDSTQPNGDIISGSEALRINPDRSIRILSYTTNGILKVSGGDGTIGVAVAGDFPTLNQNTTGSAATLTTARNFTINGTAKSFNGSADVAWTAAEIGLTSYLPLVGGQTMSGGYTISNANNTYTSPSTTNVPNIYIYNSNNSSTTAHSILTLRTNTANGGNPFISFDVNGVQGYTVGIDNADSDAFKIAPNWDSFSTPAIRIASDASIRFPQQTTNGFVKFTGANGTISVDPTTYNSGSGNSGYIAKYTGGNTTGNSILYEDGVKLYLNTTTSNSISTGGFTVANPSSSSYVLYNNGTTAGVVGFIYGSSVAAGMTVSATNGLRFETGNAAGDAWDERARFHRTSGNFTIGYGSNPADSGFRLDVSGTTRLAGALTGTSATFSGNIGVGGAAATYPIRALNASNGTSAAFGGTAYGVRIDNGGTFSTGRSTIYGVDNTFYASYQPLAIGGSELYFSISGVDKFSISSTGAATFSSAVISQDFFRSYFGFNNYRGGVSRGGLYDYATISGAGTDYSTTLFSETGQGIYFAANGSATRMMSLTSGGNLLVGTTSDNGARLRVVGGTIDFAGDTRYGVARIYNASVGDMFGIEQVGSTQTGTGGAATRMFAANSNGNYLSLGWYTNATAFTDGLKIAITSGDATFIAKVTAAGGFFDTSDARVKNIIERNPILDINVDLVKYTKKGDNSIRYGYIAQEVQNINGDVVGGNDILTLNYQDIHSIKIAALEREIKELKSKLN